MNAGPRFSVGQVVRFLPGTHERAYGGLYEVVARLPEERGERQYRVRSTQDGHERMVRESQISRPAEEAPPEPRAAPDKGERGLLSAAERSSLRRLVTGSAPMTLPIGHLTRFRHLGLTKPTSSGETLTDKGKAEARRRPR
jgi:hypothetical protein